MKAFCCLLIILSIFFAGSLYSQCPDRDSLYQRLSFIQNQGNQTGDTRELLRELLAYEARMQKCSDPMDSTRVFLLQRIASLLFRQQAFSDAIARLKESIAMAAAPGKISSIPPAQVVRSYYMLSSNYGELRQNGEMMKALDSCIAVAGRYNFFDVFALYAMVLQVKHSFDMGDYERTLQLARLGGNISMQPGNWSRSDYQNFFSGWVINALIALKRFSQAEKVLAERIEECKRQSLTEHLSTYYDQLAQVQVKLGNISQAKNLFEKAYRLDLANNQLLGCAQTLNNIAYFIHSRLAKDDHLVIATYRQAIRHLDLIKNPDREVEFEKLNIYGNIAYAFLAKQQYDTALFYFQKGLEQIRPGITDKELLQANLTDASFKKIRYVVSLLIQKGEVYSKRYGTTRSSADQAEAIRIYKLTDQLLDKLKADQSEIESKLFWRKDSRSLYEHAIEACYLAGQPEQAFYFFEKSRAALLNEQLNETRWLAESDMLMLAQAKRKILQLEQDFDKGISNGSNPPDAETQLFNHRHQLMELLAGLRVKYPLYYQSFFDTTMISVKEVRQKIFKEHRALVEIFEGDSAVYAWIATGNALQLNRISKPEFDSLAGLFNYYVSSSTAQNRNYRDFVKVSEQLYRLIFEKAELPRGRIIISPDKTYFPFEALIISDQPVTYLLNDFAVSYTYSARYLVSLFETSAPSRSGSFMGVAPVRFQPDMQLVSLPGSDRSITDLQHYFPHAGNLLSSAATRQNFLSRYQDYRIIQLYTHSSDSSVKNEPVIYFADSALYLSELIGEKKPVTRLIVLSACETGRGMAHEGEGIFSFNRGFAALGIPSAITNLWSVDNESTYEVTAFFYRSLLDGNPADVALQQAKLEFMKKASRERSLSYYWAGPVLVGMSDPIRLERPFPWKWSLIGLLLVAVVCAVWYFKYRKK